MDKLKWVCSQLPKEKASAFYELRHYWHEDAKVQQRFDEFSENTISNFTFPYSVAPNFLINGKNYCVPMVIEESSVVAAASKAANFWSTRGGFKAQVLGEIKSGQVHFFSEKPFSFLKEEFSSKISEIKKAISVFDSNMIARGGGVQEIALIDKTSELENYFQIDLKFKTCNAMGANYINTILEEVANFLRVHWPFAQVNMAILSNYTPDCLVEASVSCPIDSLGENAQEFVLNFKRAIDISHVDKTRAVTHNKGIFNGVDAVILATGNDFRAVEACGHAYAAREGKYKGLSQLSLENNHFRFSLTLPLSVGTVGGLTNLHPLAKASLDVLGNPSASELMMIAASVGLAQNFAAINSLVTTGIQKGHMKMHLLNILSGLEASRSEIEQAKSYFSDKTVSYTAVRNFLASMRISQ